MKELKIRIKDNLVISKLENFKKRYSFKSDNEMGNFLIEKAFLNLNENEEKIIKSNLDENTKKTINYIRLSLDEMYVTLNIIKHLAATIYNVKLEELDGEKLDREIIETGALSYLPERLREIENSVTKKMEMERKKNG